MRREELYLRDIVEAVDSIERFLDQVTRAKFIESELLQSAVLQKLTVIGEAAARISNDFKDRHNEINWKIIIGFRNIVVHQYFSIDWEVVWTTATIPAITLRKQILKIIEQEFSDNE